MEHILGHEQIVKTLRDACDTERISHAYLFEGAKGIGRFTTAMYFIKSQFCESEKERPCGICAACRKVQNGNHEHVYCVHPDGNSIKDAQIEEVQSLILKKAYDDLRTFIVIDEAGTMTARAQNRILKTLEEPPLRTTFILLAENSKSMAMTILSRCVNIQFKPVGRKKIIQFLKEKGISETKAETIAALSFGLPGRMISLLESAEADGKRKAAVELAIKMAEEEAYYRCAADIAELAAGKEEALELLHILEGAFRDMMLIAAGAGREIIIHVDYFDRMTKASRKAGKSRLSELIYKAETAGNDIAMNVNVNYSLKNMMLYE